MKNLRIALVLLLLVAAGACQPDAERETDAAAESLPPIGPGSDESTLMPPDTPGSPPPGVEPGDSIRR